MVPREVPFLILAVSSHCTQLVELVELFELVERVGDEQCSW